MVIVFAHSGSGMEQIEFAYNLNAHWAVGRGRAIPIQAYYVFSGVHWNILIISDMHWTKKDIADEDVTFSHARRRSMQHVWFARSKQSLDI